MDKEKKEYSDPFSTATIEVALKSRVLLGKGEIQQTGFDQPWQILKVVPDVVIGKCISIVFTLENHDKPFCEVYKCPNCHNILPKEKDFEGKLNKDWKLARVQDLLAYKHLDKEWNKHQPRQKSSKLLDENDISG